MGGVRVRTGARARAPRPQCGSGSLSSGGSRRTTEAAEGGRGGRGPEAGAAAAEGAGGAGEAGGGGGLAVAEARALPAAPGGFLEDPGSDIWIKALSSLDCKHSFKPQAIPCSITWRRNMPTIPSSPDDCTVKTEEEKEVLVLLEPADFLKRLYSLTQTFVDASSGSQPDLNQVLPLASLEGSSTKTCSLAVVGLDAYRCNQEQNGWQALSPGKQSSKSQPGPELFMTQQEILEAQVVLQLWGNIDVQLLDTWQEFGEHISALTKAIARRPYKSQLEMQELSFCTAGVSGKGLRVEKDGTGLWQVWKRQIQQFNRVSPATAAAIAEAYPSPGLLVQAYEECSTEGERLLLLSNIPVKSDISGKDHRVGPDLSRRIYLFMASTSPDLILDLTV
ncbi:probable crossover junction endonuclease EME2 isoform X2 [Tympanuchus pallidicinctus]|uniref:probable crossover junction endonuclease EME2 isoform X2 n=1 Tax=Tympanuchus pallidicinctus TaxID=109042 RepID=UPI0022872504|nr:probable crossover junction endonuclease EME2 isoform X2 [Tympanuchus pallidicinctus]